MSPYALAVITLALALSIQCIAAGVMTWAALRPPYRRTAMALAIGFGLLALDEAYTLELALHAGIFDLRQAILAAAASMLLLLGLAGFRR